MPPTSTKPTNRGDLAQVDPYAPLRTAMGPEYEGLSSEEIAERLGFLPSAVALHQQLGSSALRQATLAAILGRHARQSVHADGVEISVPSYLRLIGRLSSEAASLSETQAEEMPAFQGEALSAFEAPLAEQEFAINRLPAAVQEKFAKTGPAAWLEALDAAIQAGIRNPGDLADLIFFMQHRDRVTGGVGTPLKAGDLAFLFLRAEWALFQTIATRRLNPAAVCPLFLPGKASSDYEQYVAKPTTGLITLMVNGRTNLKGTRNVQIEAFQSMQQTVESLGKGDSLFIANWQFRPESAGLSGSLSGHSWLDLLAQKAKDGVRIRIIISDLTAAAGGLQTDLTPLKAAINALAKGVRDNWKFIFSQHPGLGATHHQKILIANKGGSVSAYCGGLDISSARIPSRDGVFVWHDVHAKLEGLIARDVEREFVLRWNREKDKTHGGVIDGWSAFETLKPAPVDRSDASPARNTHKLQMLRTVSVGPGADSSRRDDIWQAYFQLIGCATRFIFLENQYFHVPLMADAIVKQAQAHPDLMVIVVASTVTDDKDTPLKENMQALRHEFLTRLKDNIPASRLGLFTMTLSLAHSKLILVDDHMLSMGSANANPRDFFMDTQINVLLDDAQAVKDFRVHLWAHDLGLEESTIAGWNVADFVARWNEVADANAKLRMTPLEMAGEAIVRFDTTVDVGTRHEWLDLLSEAGGETPLASEGESSVTSEFEAEVFDPLNPPENVASVLRAKDWTGALNLAIQLGMRDENSLTNLIFFGKHQELPHGPLDPKDPKFKQLSTEWAQILYGDVWSAIKAASGNDSLVVGGEEVADHDRFYWGSNGKKLKKLVEDAANDAGLNPGLLGTVIMAETRSPGTFLSSEKVSSYFIGTDDFWEAQGAMAKLVPAFRKVKFDKYQTPRVHLNDAKANPRQVKSILFDSGPDALLATAVYLKMREVRLREIAKDMKADFEALPIETRLALTRMAMAAGTKGVTPLLKDALAGRDILIRKPIPVEAYQTQRNGTVRTAQAMHLSEWIFGIKVLPSASTPPGLGGPSDAMQKHESATRSESSEFENTLFVTIPRETGSEYEDQVGQLGLGTRKQVTDTKLIPFRWICSIWTSRRITTASHSENRGLSPAGTGLLISPCHVLTAAHLLKDYDTSSSSPAMVEAETAEVSPGRDVEKTPLGKYKAKSWVLHPRWDPKKSDPRTDYAVITLETCAGDQKIPSLGNQPLGFWPLGLLPAAAKAGLIGGDILTAGYPESQHEEMWCFSGKGSTGSAAQDDALAHSQQGVEPWVRVHDSFFVTADADHGQSGSPVWAISNGKRYVVGMLVDAGTTLNTALLLNDDVIQQIQAWINPKRPSHEVASEAYESPQTFGEQTGPSEFEQIYVRELGAPYIGHTEIQESLEEREDPPPRGLILFDHKHIPKTLDSSAPGGFRTAASAAILKPSDMNPGFINSSDELVTNDGPSGLQTCLKQMVTSKLSKFLASKTATAASGNDRLHIGVVDLTGAKLAKPEFAGWGSTVAMYGASSPKMLTVYAAFQLRRDLREMAEDQAIPTGKELLDFALATWKGKKVGSGLPDLKFLFDILHWTSGQPNDINFAAAAKTALNSVSDNDSASLIISGVGFPYIASVAWQSGLRHSTRGGLWLSQSYDGTTWADSPAMKAPAFVHNLTALSAATFLTLLAQGRLVDDSSSSEIATVLSVGGCKSCLFPGEINLDVAKCGILKPHMHDCVLARRAGLRYAAAILTELDATWPAKGCVTGTEATDYTNMWEELDKLVVANSAATRPVCA